MGSGPAASGPPYSSPVEMGVKITDALQQSLESKRSFTHKILNTVNVQGTKHCPEHSMEIKSLKLLRVECLGIPSNLPPSLMWERSYEYPHFCDYKIEARLAWVPCSRVICDQG